MCFADFLKELELDTKPLKQTFKTLSTLLAESEPLAISIPGPFPVLYSSFSLCSAESESTRTLLVPSGYFCMGLVRMQTSHLLILEIVSFTKAKQFNLLEAQPEEEHLDFCLPSQLEFRGVYEEE